MLNEGVRKCFGLGGEQKREIRGSYRNHNRIRYRADEVGDISYIYLSVCPFVVLLL